MSKQYLANVALKINVKVHCSTRAIRIFLNLIA
jgi:hypothetical protein